MGDCWVAAVMSDVDKPKPQRKIGMQALALAMILLPPIGLIFTVAAGYDVATLLLLAVVVAGNVLGMWVS